jgi:hypothetical protein
MSLIFPVNPLFARGGAKALNIADAFKTNLYTGNASARTITTDHPVDMAWIKGRSGTTDHAIYDAVRGTTLDLVTNSTAAQTTQAQGVTAFSSTGFSIGTLAKLNTNSATYASWTFRRAPKFFDVVTYTGDGVAGRTIAHNLGVVPGMIVVKRRDSTGDWWSMHRGTQGVDDGGGKLDWWDHALRLNLTNAITGSNLLNNTTPTATHITLSNFLINVNGNTYVAYLFAHDPDPKGVIQCGSYVGNGSSTGPVITLGWEPQWVLIKRSDSTGDWWIYDNARSTTNPRIRKLLANSGAAEDTSGEDVDFTSTGFQPKTTATGINANTGNYIYVAIRKEGT